MPGLVSISNSLVGSVSIGGDLMAREDLPPITILPIAIPFEAN